MERLFSAAAFGDSVPGVGTAWTYDRSARSSLMYGMSSSYPDSEGPGFSAPQLGRRGPGAAWTPAGRPLGVSGLLDSRSTGPEASLSHRLSAMDSHMSQFGGPFWQNGTHSGSGYSPSMSALPAYQHPGSFPGRPLSHSFSLPDSAAFSPGLLSSHDYLLHMKSTPSSLAFGQVLSSQDALFRRSQESQVPSKSHLASPRVDLLSSQLHSQSAPLYNASSFSSAPVHPQTPQHRDISAQDNIMKRYQSMPPGQSMSMPQQQQQYLTCAKSPDPRQRAIEQQGPIPDIKPSLRMNSQAYLSPYITSEETGTGYSSLESSSFLSYPQHTHLQLLHSHTAAAVLYLPHLIHAMWILRQFHPQPCLNLQINAQCPPCPLSTHHVHQNLKIK
ncbi:hypothetical protein WMY93_032285 [Mugilogobius chulae]|uniref:Uncharacterized protein n=1 Tax=Mugilogobius chulae TaxID=88201 RepID=A0AAW0MP70_9GOBI